MNTNAQIPAASTGDPVIDLAEKLKRLFDDIIAARKEASRARYEAEETLLARQKRPGAVQPRQGDWRTWPHVGLSMPNVQSRRSYTRSPVPYAALRVPP
jgi:hypothetical protein